MSNMSFDTERLNAFINGIIADESATIVQSAGNAALRRRRVIRESPGRRVRDGPERRVPKPERVVIPEPCTAEIHYVCGPEQYTAEIDYVCETDSEDAEPPKRRSSFREAMIREGVLMPIPGSTMLINPALYDAHMRRMQVDALCAQPSRSQLMLEDLRKNGINSERFKGFRKINDKS